MIKTTMIWLTFLMFVGKTIAANSGYYWHITDFHYDHSYWTDQLSCNDEVPTPGKYGDYWCDSPWLLIQDSITSMTNIKQDIDFIIWTGDNVAHIKDNKINLQMYIEIIRNITEVFKSKLPGVKIYASLGNHDFYPTSQANYTESDIYQEVSEMWRSWVSNQTDVQVLKKGGYYMVKVQPKIRLVALNTVLYFRSNKLTADMDDPADQMVWMTSQFQDARNKEEKVIVTAHVPPGLLVPGLIDWFNPRHKTHFVDILLQFSDVIVAAHFGHDHMDSFKILQNKNGNNAVAHFSAPSVTPWRHKIPTETGLPHNPGIRLIEYDRNTGLHINYDQYYMNLTDSNREGIANWTKLYSFKDAYSVDNMNVASLRKIFSRLESGKGLSYANKYCTYSLVSNYQIQCTDQARADIYCGGLKHDQQEAKDCRINYLKSLNVATFISFNYCSLFIVSAVSYFCARQE